MNRTHWTAFLLTLFTFSQAAHPVESQGRSVGQEDLKAIRADLLSHVKSAQLAGKITASAPTLKSLETSANRVKFLSAATLEAPVSIAVEASQIRVRVNEGLYAVEAKSVTDYELALLSALMTSLPPSAEVEKLEEDLEEWILSKRAWLDFRGLGRRVALAIDSQIRAQRSVELGDFLVVVEEWANSESVRGCFQKRRGSVCDEALAGFGDIHDLLDSSLIAANEELLAHSDDLDIYWKALVDAIPGAAPRWTHLIFKPLFPAHEALEKMNQNRAAQVTDLAFLREDLDRCFFGKKPADALACLIRITRAAPAKLNQELANAPVSEESSLQAYLLELSTRVETP